MLLAMFIALFFVSALVYNFLYRKERDRKIDSGNEEVDTETTMPYEDVLEDLCKYDASKPKMDELLLIKEMQEKYGQDRQTVIKRIREVRREEIRKRKKNKMERRCINE